MSAPDTQGNPTPNKSTTQPSSSPNVIDHPADGPVEYDTTALRGFLTTVFHSAPLQNESVLTWATQSSPGYPITIPDLEHKLSRSRAPMALYFGTSTVTPDKGRLRNRYSSFCRLHVVVLDDIGSKVDPDTIPKALQSPSYVIETSPENYQYGYVLDEPIAHLEPARALIQLVYDSGWSDGGGALPTKLVRLPGGVNGKPQEDKRNFRVRLDRLTSRRWSPSELLEAAQCSTLWADVLNDARAALRRPQARSVTPWSAIEPVSPNLDGGVDPVLEWLYSEKLVLQEVNDWVTLECPWAYAHTTGGSTAGYAPLGRGEGFYANRRGFKCFHDHCKERTAQDFLDWVVACDGPSAATIDYAGDLQREWVYDPIDDKAYHIRGDRIVDKPVAPGPLRHLFPKKVRVNTGVNHKALVGTVDLWLRSPSKVVVSGAMSDPSTNAPLTQYEGHTRVNLFHAPAWGPGEIYEDDLEMFLGFVEYLVPNEDEREFFLDWLAAKVQCQAFRGPCILMVTPTYGTGRTTLGELIEVLLGPHNTVRINFDELVGKNEFNDWQLHTLAMVNETLELGDQKFYRVYERLKGLIEFQPTRVKINPKGQQARMLPVYTSYLMFSNHPGALAITETDRRFYVISNPLEKRPPEYFTELYEWKAEIDPETGLPAWAPSIARWLCERKPDMDALHTVPPSTMGKQRMIETTRTAVDTAVIAVLDAWKGPLIAHQIVVDALEPFMPRLGIVSHIHLGHQVRRVLDKLSHPIDRNLRCRAWKMQVRPRILTSALTDENRDRFIKRKRHTHASYMTKLIEQNDREALKQVIADALTIAEK